MILEYQILIALLLDALIGDPRWLPHPVKMIGWLSIKVEIISRSVFRNDWLAGIVAMLVVLLVTGFCGWGLIRGVSVYFPLAGDIISVLTLYTCFAWRDLISHSKKVHAALQKNDLAEARRRVGMIVGRDPSALDEAGVARAAVESVAENTVDGITAPLFWAVIAGPVGALLYKAANTMDSTFGYKNERYIRFGWAAARFDDLVNFLPARLSGLFTVLAAGLLGLRVRNSWLIFWRDRGQHLSPNAGQTEAAFAGALGIILGGNSIYLGRMIEKPTIGTPVMAVEADHILLANRLSLAVTIFFGIFLLGVRLLISVHLTGGV